MLLKPNVLTSMAGLRDETQNLELAVTLCRLRIARALEGLDRDLSAALNMPGFDDGRERSSSNWPKVFEGCRKLETIATSARLGWR